MKLQLHRVQTRVRWLDRAERIYTDVLEMYDRLWELQIESAEERKRMWAAYDRLRQWANRGVL